MNSIKCRKCGMPNFATDETCRRCSVQLYYSTPLKKEKRPRRFSVISLLIYAALIFGGYYLYQEAKRSVEQVDKNDAFRVSTQAPQKPQQAGLSRADQDRQRANQFADNLRDNPSFKAKRQQEEQTNKAVEQASGGQ